jgi:hypothetical protein
MSHKEMPCYKCKAIVTFNIPVVTSKKFKSYMAKCECGHEMITFRYKNEQRYEAFKSTHTELKEALKDSKNE